MASTPTAPFVAPEDHPAETLRLIAECRDALLAEGNPWANYFADRTRSLVEKRSFFGVLWCGPGGEAVGMAGWEVSGTVGRRGWLYLSEGCRSRAMLERFLVLLDSNPAGELPFVSWADDLPGVSSRDREAVFSARGFSPVVRADMRLPPGIKLPHPTADPRYSPRSLTLADEPLIADLLFRVYEGEPERALFAVAHDERVDARLGTHGLLHGEVGRWLPEASFGIEHEGRLIAHTQANELEGGLITEVGVDPAFRRQGLAHRLLPLTVDALRSMGFEVPRLVVTMWNSRAVHLYRSLGFEFKPDGAGRVWLNLPIFGLNPPRG